MCRSNDQSFNEDISSSSSMCSSCERQDSVPSKGADLLKNEVEDEVTDAPMEEPKLSDDTLTSSWHFWLLTLAMFIFFGAHNILQEAIMKIPGFTHGVMLGYMEVIGVTICSFLERKYVAKETNRVAPISAYPLLTICLMASSSLSNMSLNYINFPTKVVFRSCKLIPTMIIATMLNKQTFSSVEYTSALAISAGLVIFAAVDWKLTPTYNPIGLVLVGLSVVADAILPNAQEKLFKLGSSRLEVTFYTNFFTLIAMSVTTLASGTLPAAMKLAFSDRQLAMYMIVYTGISYIAISTFMMIVKKYGGVAAVLLATARKAMTLILSFLLFPKAFSWYYVVGATLVLGGLLTVSMMKLNKKKKEKVIDEVEPLLDDEDDDDSLEKGQAFKRSNSVHSLSSKC